jgi:hypothetical protein
VKLTQIAGTEKGHDVRPISRNSIREQYPKPYLKRHGRANPLRIVAQDRVPANRQIAPAILTLQSGVG